MVEGRLRKFYEEVVLLKQAFVPNPDVTVSSIEGRRKRDRRSGDGFRLPALCAGRRHRKGRDRSPCG